MKLLVGILIRQAIEKQPGNPRGWLVDLQGTLYDKIAAQGGQIIGTSVNGKTVQLQSIAGSTDYDRLIAVEEAIRNIDAGLTTPKTETVATFR